MQPAQQPPAYQQQTMVAQQQPVAAVHQGSNGTTNSQNGRREKWCWKGLRITGYLQVIMGVSAVLFGTISIIVKTFMFVVGTPIWSGICFFIVAGVLGIAAGRKQRTGLVVGYMVMSILSSLAAVCVIGFGAGAIQRDFSMCPEDWISPFRYSNFYQCSTSSGLRIGIDVCLLLIGLTEFVIAVVGASFTCVSLSVSRSSTPRAAVRYQAYRQQMVIGAPPQGVYYPLSTNVACPNQVVMQPQQFVVQPQAQYVMQPQAQYVVQPQTQYAVQPSQMYLAQPQGQFQPLLQGQIQPPPQGQIQPPPQGQIQPPPQGQLQPPSQEQLQPSPQEQYPPQAGEQIHPETPLSHEEDLKQPLTN